MNIYDKINDLANGIKETKEFKEFVEIKNEVYKDESKKEKINKFRQMQIDWQRLATNPEANQKELEEKNALLQQMYQMLLQDEQIKKFFDVEVRFDIIVGDMYRIIGEALKEAMGD
ncbi:MAG: YlbF family regulator [Clostridia bacterium]|nr:YlbF family regulator [Clostridia bacterium]